ncbi:MAG: hypothetical protein ABGW56_02735 [Flavobacteriaceae bacterium]
MRIEKIESLVSKSESDLNNTNSEIEKLVSKKLNFEKERKSKNDTIERNILEINKNEEITKALWKKYGNDKSFSYFSIWLFVGGIVLWIWFSFWVALLNTIIAVIWMTARDKRVQKKLNKTAYKTHKDEIKNLQNNNSKLLKEISIINEDLKKTLAIISDKKSNLDRLKQGIKNNNRIISFNKKYDIDNNDKLDIAETTNIEKLFSNNQKQIREIEKAENRDYIKDLTQVCMFLESFQKQLELDYSEIQSSTNSVSIKITQFEESLRTYKALMSGMVLMISNIVNDNLLGYYKLRDLFDKLSIFESNYEKKLINKLETLNEATRELINITASSRDEIVDALYDVDVSLGNIEAKWTN